VSRLDESSRETTLSDEEANNTGDIEDSARGIARTRCLLSCLRRKLVTKNDTQERAVNVEAAVIFDIAQLPEFVHEEAYTAPRRTDHFR